MADPGSLGICEISISESCNSSGGLDLIIQFGDNLKEMQVQAGGINYQSASCNSTPLPPLTFTLPINPVLAGWDDIEITGYCYESINWIIYDQQSGADPPSWAVADCGVSTLSSATAIYFFYDTTSLDDSEQSAAYIAANDWIIALRASGTYTGKVYHCEAFGERWVLWPAWITDHNINAGGTDNHSNACNTNPSCHDQSATPWVFAQGTNTVSGTHWTNDPNASLGLGQTTKTLPVAAEGPTADILCVIFADESTSVPSSGYRADPANQTASTGDWGPSGATTGSWPEFGHTASDNLREGYHWRYSSGANQVTDWEEATGNNSGSGTELTDLWKYDVLRAKSVVSNHQSSGTLKTFVYPAVHSSPNGSQTVFPLHVLGAIHTGTYGAGLAPACAIADLVGIETSNPYSTPEGGRFGRLDALNFGTNVACVAFAAATFVTDVEAFISGGTGVTCDQTDCLKVFVIDAITGVGVPGHSVNIDGTSYTTDASGYTTMLSGLSSIQAQIGNCYVHSLYRNCIQHLVTLPYFSHTHVSNLECTPGCTDNWTVNGCGLGCNGALNYDPLAAVDDGSCIYCVYGCTNPLSLNYNPLATCDDGSCQVMPETAECLLQDISKQLLEDCSPECDDSPKAQELRSDLQYAESLLAQFYMLQKCAVIQDTELDPSTYASIFTAFGKLFQKYQCDNCGQYHPGSNSIVVENGGGGTPGDCDVAFGGSCSSLQATPGIDVIAGITSIDNTDWNSMGDPPAQVNLGNVTGLTAYERHLCFDDLAQELEACGMSTIGIDTKIYCFYDGTSLGQAAVQAAFLAVMDWLDQHPDFTPVLRDPSQQVNYNNQNSAGTYTAFSYGTTTDENVFHTSISGEQWLDWGIVPMTGIFDNSVDKSAEQTAQSNKGGYIGDHLGAGGNHTGGTKHVEGVGHAAGESAGYSYTGSTGTITGKLNHWVGWGVSLAGTKTGAPTDTEWPMNFAAMAAGSANRATSLSKPDGTEFNNGPNNLRTTWLWPLYPNYGRSTQAINWSFNQWKNSTVHNLAGGGTVQPVQFYCPSSYDTVTGQGPKGHSVYTYNSSTYTAPNTWTKLAEEADTATANNTSDPDVRSRNNAVHLGPPPIADPANDNVLVIVFADESNPGYHDRSSGATPQFTGSFYSLHRSDYNPYYNSPGVITGPGVPHLANFTTYGLADERIVQPTYRYKYDLLEFNARRAAYVAVAGKSYQAFFYPSRPASTSSPHEALPLQGVAAIANGTNLPLDGMWQVGSVPTTSGTNTTDSPYPDQTTGINDKCAIANLTALEVANPYWNLTDHPMPTGNTDSINWGGLENKGWWINSQCRSFSAARFEQDLEIFLGQGGTSCDETDCINFEILYANGTPLASYSFLVNGITYTTDAAGKILNSDHAALSGLIGTITFGFPEAETYSYTLPGLCTEFTFQFVYGESNYDICLIYPAITCACGDEDAATIQIFTGSHTPTDITADGIIGTITNATTGVITDILETDVSGAAPNIVVTVEFTGSALTSAPADLPDGRYILELENLNDNPWKECKLILCQATTRLQILLRDNMCNIKCDKCGKIYDDFVKAYTLFRALKITGWDPEYAAYIDSNITELHTALTAAESGNCKCC